ncbi:MAG: hypothetical protein AAGG38_13805 [Planctomycetota bacterium]
MRTTYFTVAMGLGLAVGASGAQAASVLDVETSVAVDNGLRFTSVTLDTPSGATRFSPGDFVNIEVLDFAVATTIPFETALGGTLSTPDNPGALPPVGGRAAILEDALLNTTINNPSVDTGLVFRFVDPDGSPTGITNRPGADLVVFEVSPPAGVEPPSGGPTVLGGDPFRLSGTGDAADNTAEFFADDYVQIGPNGTAADISFFGPAPGTSPVASLTEFEGVELTALGVFSLNLYAADIDLSDLGFAEGDVVETLTLNSIGETGFGTDPSLILGIVGSGVSVDDADAPAAIPTPTTAAGGALLLLGIAARRRRVSAD